MAVVSVVMLAGCGQTETANKPSHYYGNSETECKQILFTCPQYEESFTDGAGCGCKPSGSKVDNVDERSLDYLITKYLREKMLEPSHGGHVIAEFSRIGSAEQGMILTEEIYGAIGEFYMNGDQIAYGSKNEGLMQLTIEETNHNYIIRNSTVLGVDSLTDAQKQAISEESRTWLAKAGNLDDLKMRVKTMLKQEAAISFGRTMEDFADYVAPVGAKKQQGPGPQQTMQSATQQGSQPAIKTTTPQATQQGAQQ